MRHERCWLSPWVGTIPWKKAWKPTPVFLLGEPHGQRNLAGYSPWGYKELDTIEQLSTHTHTHTHTSREKEILRKNQKELLEIRNTVNEMKNAFEELISGIGMIEERISEFEDISKETFKTEDNKK